MKVLQVIDALGVGGGAEHSLATMLPLLRDRGVDSSVVCLLPREGGLQKTLRDRGFSVEVLASTSWPGRLLALRRKVVAEAPDIVHATLFNSCLAARLACIGMNVCRVDSLVNTSYDPVRTDQLDIPRWKLTAVRTVDGWTARHLGGYFHAVSATVASEALGVLGIAPDRITVVPRGRSAAQLGERDAGRRSHVRSRLAIEPDTPVILNAGRQDSQKAQASLVHAFAAVRAKNPDAVLVIAGREGDATQGIARARAETGLGEDAVRMVGHRTDILDLYVACDVFVFPSLYEGAAGSLVEAMALSTPIIGSDAPAIAEVLSQGECGVVVPRGNVAALADAMLELLGDPARQKELGQRGRRRFLEFYELENVVDAMVAMYADILAARS